MPSEKTTEVDTSLPSKITASKHTPFQKSVYHALLAIPRGSYTTYALLAGHLKTSPRAVGNALRENSFAPDVPCHRVVAADRSIGGFKGATGEESDEIREKRGLLRTEGVAFDTDGKVRGTPWGGW